LGYTVDEALDLPYRAIPAILSAVTRLKNRDRVESLRISLASQAKQKYITDLMKYYSDGVKSLSEIERNKLKAVDTKSAFEAFKAMR